MIRHYAQGQRRAMHSRDTSALGRREDPALETISPVVSPCHHKTTSINELDVAYEAILEAERETWCERAD
jgi:hypothetical protein